MGIVPCTIIEDSGLLNDIYLGTILDKLKPNQNEDLFKKGISGQRWINYFKSVLTSDTAQPLPENPNENGPFDYPITDDEINIASYILKPGKAVVADGVSNKMISCLLEYDSKIFHTFFNAIISKCEIIEAYRFCLALGNFFQPS